MKYSVFNNDNEESIEIKNYIEEQLEKYDFEIDEESPELVITVGGDGTLLAAFHHYENQLDSIRFTSVHTGHLGFYTDWLKEDVDHLIQGLATDEGEDISYPILKVGVTARHGATIEKLALNEATVRRYEGTMKANIYIKDELFERYRGDGLCISTPTGSTGLNKSLGGAVIHPSLRSLQLTEIAPLNNRVYRSLSSPVITCDHEWFTVDLGKEDQSGIFMTLDQFIISLKYIEKVRFEVAEQQIHFSRYRHMHFWDRVRQSFISDQPGAK